MKREIRLHKDAEKFLQKADRKTFQRITVAIELLSEDEAQPYEKGFEEMKAGQYKTLEEIMTEKN